MEIIKSSRVSDVMKSLEEAANDKRRRQVADWIEALKAAEVAAKAVPDARLRLYQANYRVEDQESEDMGRNDQRRSALIAMLKSLAPRERHPGTSTWIFQLHIERATEIANLLAAPLDTAIDFLAVAELNANRTVVGNAKLKS